MVFQAHNYCLFDIVLHKWNIERILWIGFYKNDKNDTCLIKNLPKDVVLFILQFLSLRNICDAVIPSTHKC